MRAALFLAALALLSCRGEGDFIYADLRDATGVREGAVVRYRGVPIGQVEHVAFVDSAVRVTIGLTRPDAPLRAGDGVRLVPEGIFGDRTLEIVPGPASAPMLDAARTLGMAPPDSAAELRREVLEAAAAAALRQLGGALQRDTARRDSGGSTLRQRRP